ncbi:hypothetical protein INT44_000206 [Umbelopsis vinacea]|uniref:Uncharacterized protein n=1 Tax=Umbelopsis vinacea TaxID=44442 RepID=A0A8H7PHI6_9FUNG|nr:hypothetical protein INT44_000206 [Umbelopsis vinacea]
MLYLAKLITAVLVTGSFVVAYTEHSKEHGEHNHYPGYEPYGCKVTVNGHPDGAFDGKNKDATLELNLLKGNYVAYQFEGPIKTDMDNEVCDTLWYVNKTLPVGDDYFLQLKSSKEMDCKSSFFSIKAFSGDNSAQSLLHEGVPMVVPAAPGTVQKRSLVEKVASASSRKADSSLANLVAGLLVFGAFL